MEVQAGSPSALGERNFRLYFFGDLASTLGSAAVPVALAFAVLRGGHSPTDLGIVLAAKTLPTVIFLLIGGVYADRLPRQLVMICSDVCRFGVELAVAVLLFSGQLPIWLLSVLMVAFGVGDAFFQPSATGLLPKVVSAGRLQQANGVLTVSSGVAWVAGPALASLGIFLVGPALVFVFDAATFAVSAVCLAVLRLPAVIIRRTDRNFFRELAQGWSELISRTWLWLMIAAVGSFFFFVVGPFYVLGPSIAVNVLGGAGAWALIAGALSLGRLAGGATAMFWEPKRPLLFGSALMLLEFPPMVLLAVHAPAIVTAGAQVLGGAAIGFFMTVWETTLQQAIPGDVLSRISSYDWLGTLVLMPISYALVGPVAQAVGQDSVLWASAAWVVVMCVVLVAVPSVRRLVPMTSGRTAPAVAVPSEATSEI
jgi:MFS family permease